MGWFKKEILSNGSEEGKSVKVPLGLWVKCENCGEIIYKKEAERNLDVCPKCNYHFRISAQTRLDIVMDAGTFVEHDQNIGPVASLDFKDLKRYRDRIKS
ncbi:MAG: acetyl-CoA carboxylase carboxyl transferase subunit beta, partial [Deltaproteobacteria bacterium]|nr:acetyl-CoA carboxylase carboxyl transferase subunit beta [Deltaproteobacteria bacterium]